MNMRQEIGLRAFLDQLPRDPVHAITNCRGFFANDAKEHHQVVHDCVAFIVAFVRELRTSEAAKSAFLNHEFWREKPYKTQEKNLDRLAAMFVVGVSSSRGALYQRAREYAKVVTYYVDRDIEPFEISRELDELTIYKLIDKIDAGRPGATPRNNRPKANSANVATNRGSLGDGSRGSGSNPHDASEVDDADVPSSVEQTNRRSAMSKQVSRSTRYNRSRSSHDEDCYPFDPQTEIAIYAEQFFDELFNLEQGDQVTVRLERLPDKGRWATFQIIAIDL